MSVNPDNVSAMFVISFSWGKHQDHEIFVLLPLPPPKVLQKIEEHIILGEQKDLAHAIMLYSSALRQS